MMSILRFCSTSILWWYSINEAMNCNDVLFSSSLSRMMMILDSDQPMIQKMTMFDPGQWFTDSNDNSDPINDNTLDDDVWFKPTSTQMARTFQSASMITDYDVKNSSILFNIVTGDRRNLLPKQVQRINQLVRGRHGSNTGRDYVFSSPNFLNSYWL